MGVTNDMTSPSIKRLYMWKKLFQAMLAIDGAGFDWSYMADDEIPTNMALMAFSDSEVHNDKTCLKTYLKSFETLKTQLDDLRIEFNKSEFNLANYKRGLTSIKEKLDFYKKNEVIFCEHLAVLKRDISYKDSEISMLKSELEKLKQEKESNQLKIENFDNASKSLDKLIGSQITDNSRKGVGFVSYNVVLPPPTGLFSPPKFDLSNSGLEEFQQPEFEGYEPKLSKSVSEDTSNELRESLDTPLVEELVSNDKSQSPRGNQRNWNNQKSQQLGNDFVMYNKVCFLSGSFDHVQANCNYHQRERVVNVVKASACWVRRPTKLNSASITLKRHNYVDARGRSKVSIKKKIKHVDSGCSRHMTRNMSYLSDFKEFDGGYLADESQVLLKVPRKNNMYSVDMKNIVPKESLTCLVAKATLDESMIWHRRLGHNMVLVVKPHNKTPYELFKGRTPAISFMRPFRCHVTILNTLDNLGKFDEKSDEGFFVGYSLNSKAFRVYNIRTRKVEESLHIRFLKDKPIIAGDGPKWLFDIEVLTKSMNYVPVVAGTNSNDFVGTEESIGAYKSSKET
ncbi:putative ribonuclease H-like domain-containing protein [Tanacetum coccineum]